MYMSPISNNKIVAFSTQDLFFRRAWNDFFENLELKKELKLKYAQPELLQCASNTLIDI